jgi:capsular polysaccharide biosynthesis protein
VRSPEILRRLVRRFGLLVLLTLIGGIAGAVYAAVKTPTYTAKAYVVAIADKADPVTALNFAQAYGRIATSGPVVARAGTLLGADRSGLAEVTASTSPDAPVVQVTASGTSAQHAADLANAMANALTEYGNARTAETRVNLALLAAATPPLKPSSPKPPMELAVGAAAGLLVGALAVLAGVGRTASGQDPPVEATPATPTRYQLEGPLDDRSDVEDDRDDRGDDGDGEAVEPATVVPEPLALERYTGVAQAERAPRAIASYRASAVPIYLVHDGVATAQVPQQRAVGRAAVAGAEDDE